MTLVWVETLSMGRWVYVLLLLKYCLMVLQGAVDLYGCDAIMFAEIHSETGIGSIRIHRALTVRTRLDGEGSSQTTTNTMLTSTLRNLSTLQVR